MIHETEIVEAVQERLGEGYEVKLKLVTKTNNQTRAGVMITDKKTKNITPVICPIIYLEGFIDEIDAGRMLLPDAVNEILGMYDKSKGKHLVQIINNMDREEFLQRIIPQAVSRENNTELLGNVPHKELLDIAIIYRCELEMNHGEMKSFIVTNENLGLWDVTLKELDMAAKRNVTYKRPYHIYPMDSILKNLLLDNHIEKSDIPTGRSRCEMYAVTNEGMIYGASVLDSPEIFEKLAKKLSGNLLILPSSLYEVIAIPETGNEDIASLRQTVMDINHSQLEPEEVLSNQVYRYDRDTETIEIV